MRILVNGVEFITRHEILSEVIDEYLNHHALPALKHGAVALNFRVKPFEQWTQTSVHQGDQIEIVQPIEGG